MEKNDDLKPEKKTTTRKTTTKAKTESKGAKKTSSTGTTKKKPATTTKKSSTAKKTSGTAKKTSTKKTTGTTKKTTSKKAAIPEQEKLVEEKAIKEEVKKIVESVEPIIEEKTQTQPVKQEPAVQETTDTESKETKFKPVSHAKEKKKHTCLKIVLSLIIIIIILFMVHFFRNYMIINNLMTKLNDLKGLSNYSYLAEYYNSKNPENTTLMEVYQKDDTMMIVRRSSDTNIIWSSKKDKETLYLNPQKLTATQQKSSLSNAFFDIMPLGFLYYNSQATRNLDFLYIITSEQVNGVDCYKISWLGQTDWYAKDTGVLMKTIDSKTVIDGVEYDNITEYKDWTLRELTDEKMTKPNTVGYKMTNTK